MLQADFHTGSLMVTEQTMFAIDAEFAFYGPMAFDVGKIIANLLLAYFASDGHEAATGSSRQNQRTWLLQVHSLHMVACNPSKHLISSLLSRKV